MSDFARGHAAELHRRAIVIDCHSDLLMPIADGYVRLGQDIPVPDPRAWKPPFEIPKPLENHLGFEFQGWPVKPNFGTIGQYSLPALRAGGLTAQVCAVFVNDDQLDHALRRSLEMVWWMHREAEDNPDFELVTTASDIRRMKREKKIGGVLALEGLEMIGTDLKLLDLFYKLGLRMAGLAHNRRNYFSDGTQYYVKTGGLNDIGKEAIRRMNQLGIVVDVGHFDAQGFWDALETSRAPVVLSHRSPKTFFPLRSEDSRFHGIYDLSRGKERLQALAANGGVFGVFFLDAPDVQAVVADIEYVIDQVGPDHVGLGSDLYGLPVAPKGLESMAGVGRITECMVEHGHSDEVILKVLGGNFLRVFEAVWGE